ncbi:MAG: hypothetical protein ACREX3_05015 [Gammaproteobacteria bacterium]
MNFSSSPVHELPPNLAVLVVDSKEFSKHSDLQQGQLVPAIQGVLEKATQRCGLPQLWSERRFPSTRGDGYQFGFDQKYLPHVVNRYLEALQAELYEVNHQQLNRQGARLRMRLGLNLGPVPPYDAQETDSPVGSIINDTHRLVECDQVRAMLERSDPDVTMLAAALSESVMNDVVRKGYAGRSEEEFVAVEATINSHGLGTSAYLRVPAISGDLLRYGLLGAQDTSASEQTPDVDSDVEPQADVVAWATQGASANNLTFTAGNGATQAQNLAQGDHSIVADGDIDLDKRSEVVHGDKYEAKGDVHGGRRWFGRDKGESL